MMQQYVIIARDGQDDAAAERRMTTRPIHLEGARKLKASNHFIAGGAMLNEDGQMNGSIMILQFETAEQFQDWYNNEPYITSGVWQTIEVQPFKMAAV
jgi:uncharacterized protein